MSWCHENPMRSNFSSKPSLLLCLSIAPCCFALALCPAALHVADMMVYTLLALPLNGFYTPLRYCQFLSHHLFYNVPTAMSSVQLPEIPADIDRSLSRFRNSLDSEEKKFFSQVATKDDVIKYIQTLQTEQASWAVLRNMDRIKPFIDGLSQYTRVIEIYAAVRPEVVSYIWVSSLARRLGFF